MSLHPDARMTFLDDMDKHLFKRTRIRLFRELTDILRDNSAYYVNTQAALSFRGQVYRIGNKGEPLPRPLNLCHPKMRDRLKAYLTRLEDYERERDLTLGFFGKLMLDTEYAVDIRALLPESLSKMAFCGFFLQGPGKFTPEQVEEYKVTHARYLAMLKARLVHNLCDTAPL